MTVYTLRQNKHRKNWTVNAGDTVKFCWSDNEIANFLKSAEQQGGLIHQYPIFKGRDKNPAYEIITVELNA